jgi:hypothetical protein
MTDIIFDNAKSVTTTGCPLHMWSKNIHTDLPWSNFYHSEDVLSAPLNGLFGCEDFEVKDSGPSTAIPGDLGLPFTLSAHTCYWESKTLARHMESL